MIVQDKPRLNRKPAERHPAAWRRKRLIEALGLGIGMTLGLCRVASTQEATENWSGFYLGADALRGFNGTTTLTLPPGGADGTAFGPAAGAAIEQTPRGRGWGVYLGGNRQDGHLVYGFEAALAPTSTSLVTATTRNAFAPGQIHSLSLHSVSTGEARLGYALGPALPFAKAGIAFADEASALSAPGASFVQKHWLNGWTAGLGVDYPFWHSGWGSWVLGVEYDYFRFGTRSYGGLALPDAGHPVQYFVQPSYDTLMARLLFRFGERAQASTSAPGGEAGRWKGAYAGLAAVAGTAGSNRVQFQPDGGAGGQFAPAGGGVIYQAPRGPGAGLIVGANDQAGRLVWGIEAQALWTRLAATSSNPLGTNASWRTAIDNVVAVTPRIGYAVGPLLPYVKAGMALGFQDAEVSGGSGATAFRQKNWLDDGRTAGAGIDADFSGLLPGQARIGLEYSWVRFSAKGYGGIASPNAGAPVAFSTRPGFALVALRALLRF